MKNIFFISGELAGLDRGTNLIRTKWVERLLHSAKFQFKRCKGRYKGIDEDSFCVIATPETADHIREYLFGIAKVLSQDCVMEVLNQDAALFRPNGSRIASLKMTRCEMQRERPDADHTAIIVPSGYCVLQFA